MHLTLLCVSYANIVKQNTLSLNHAIEQNHLAIRRGRFIGPHTLSPQVYRLAVGADLSRPAPIYRPSGDFPLSR
jgi:hypothetical protein